MSLPEQYQRYGEIAESLGFKLETALNYNSPDGFFKLSYPAAHAELKIYSEGDLKSMLEFLNTCHFAMQAKQAAGQLTERVDRLEREIKQSKHQPMGDAELYEDIERLNRHYAVPAGGRLEIMKVQEVIKVTYWRNSELHLDTVFSSAMLRSPFHSGQNHHFHFELPRDYDVVCRMLEHDLDIVEKRFPED